MRLRIRDLVGELAAKQHGVITFDQLRGAGVSRSAIVRRLEVGEWRRLGHRTIAVNGSPDTKRRELSAAVLSCPRAFASGRSAAWLHRMANSHCPAQHEVTVPHTGNARSGIARVRRSQFFLSTEVVEVDGIRVASRCETVFRMAEYVSERRIVRLIDDELLTNASAAEQLGDIYLRYQGHRVRGMAKLRPLLLERLAHAHVPSESALETLADEVFRSLDGPPMLRQIPLPWAPTAGRVDRYIPEWKLIIELDGRAWHTRSEAFERDRARDNAAAAHGLTTLRLTWTMLTDRPEHCRQLVLKAGRHR
ncbi:MAG: hypothetical protein HKN91_07015 [Acidimicrobiia bacterium]|nr:hypothetical protein [Acidimicrobiia bacterium]